MNFPVSKCFGSVISVFSVKFYRCKPIVLTLVSTIVLSGCAHIDFATAVKFVSVDFSTVNPETSSIAVVLPDGIDIEEVTLNVKGTLEGEVLVEGDIDMELLRSGPEFYALPKSLPRTSAIIIRVGREDLARVSLLQAKTARFIQLAESDASKKGALAVGFASKPIRTKSWNPAFCIDDDYHFEMSMWVRLERNDNYARLLGERAFRKILTQNVREEFCIGPASGG